MTHPSPRFQTAGLPAPRSRLLLSVVLLLASVGAHALPSQDEQDAAALARAEVPDTTPEQVYDTARREAYGAFHAAQRECQDQPKAERKTCLREAQQQLDADLRAAAEQRKAARP